MVLVRLSDGSALVTYNTSALAATERILRADIRYFRHPLSPGVSPKSASAVHNETMTWAIMLELASRRFRQLGKHLLMTSPSTGWVSVDVTSSLRRLRHRTRLSSRRRSSLLALTFGDSGDGEGQVPLATRRRRTAAELRLASSPILVVFTRRTADIAVDHILPRIPEYRSPLPTWSAHHRRHTQKSTRRRQRKRSVAHEDGDVVEWYPGIDNLLPLENSNYTKFGRYNVLPVLTDTARLGPEQQQQQQPHHHHHHHHQDTKTVANRIRQGVHGDLLAFYHPTSNEAEQRKTTKLLHGSSMFLESDNHQQPIVCSRRRLVVDAVDIGWNEHVIYPRQFRADYCTGSCPFPRSKDVKQINHATIQSLVHVIGIASDVPAPCCVADRMWSLPVLYVDHDDSVILTIYDDAVVRSCICR